MVGAQKIAEVLPAARERHTHGWHNPSEFFCRPLDGHPFRHRPDFGHQVLLEILHEAASVGNRSVQLNFCGGRGLRQAGDCVGQVLAERRRQRLLISDPVEGCCGQGLAVADGGSG